MGKKRWLYGDRKPTDAEEVVLRAWAKELAEHYEMNADWIRGNPVTIDEAAEKIGIDTELLREYESAGKIHPLDFIKVLEAYGMDKIGALDRLNGIGLKAWASKC